MLAVNPARVSGLRTIIVNDALTIFSALVLAARLCQGPGMETKRTQAGGCFLMATILLGFVGGLAIRDPLKGTLIGTGVGIAIAIAVWLLDRRR